MNPHAKPTGCRQLPGCNWVEGVEPLNCTCPTERKVHPIKGKHQSMSSMVAECMADPRSVRGFVIYFEEDGTMRHGHFGATRADTCMAAAYMNMLAMESMQHDD